MKHGMGTRRGNQGAALLTALGLLVVLSMLGAAYVTYALLDRDRAEVVLGQTQARMAALGGFEAAVGTIQKAVADAQGQTPVPASLALTLPVYGTDRTVPQGVSVSERYASNVTVRIVDESAKVNLNHAPTRVLEALLGVDGNTARAIRASLPALPGEPANPAGRWLTSLDDLASRKLVSLDVLKKINRDFVTVYTVEDPANPVRFININSAAPDVLAAVLNIPLDAARAAAEKRPFTSLNDLVVATGVQPASFNVAPDPTTPDALPPALALKSTCFRIVVEAVVQDKTRPNAGPQDRLEAVVLFRDNGTYDVRYWFEGEPPASNS